MCSLDTFKIDLRDLDDGISTFEFTLDDSFFEAIDAPEVRKGDLKVNLSVYRTMDTFDMDFHTEGVIRIPCTLCLEDMNQAINTDNRIIAKFGDESMEDDDLVTVDENDGILDVAWFIYEFIVLDIPIKHEHTQGECNPAMIKMMEEYSAASDHGTDDDKDIDPRWDELKKLK